MSGIIAVLVGEIQELIWRLKGSPYERYYTCQASDAKTLSNLKAELQTLREKEFTPKYSVGVYDCSEMSTKLERHLENRGYKTYACYGVVTKMESRKRERHMWLKVSTTEGLVLVEATACGIANQAKYRYEEEKCSDKIWDLGLSMREVDYWKYYEVEK